MDVNSAQSAAAKVGGIQLIAGLVADSVHPGGAESNRVLATRKQNRSKCVKQSNADI